MQEDLLFSVIVSLGSSAIMTTFPILGARACSLACVLACLLACFHVEDALMQLRWQWKERCISDNRSAFAWPGTKLDSVKIEEISGDDVRSERTDQTEQHKTRGTNGSETTDQTEQHNHRAQKEQKRLTRLNSTAMVLSRNGG